MSKMQQVTSTLRIIVENNKEHPAYVRLFDPGFEKEKVTIRLAEMEDPVMGKLADLHEVVSAVLAEQPGGCLHIKDAFLWSPALPAHAECFTLHAYEDTGKETFADLRILYFRVHPYQVRPDWIMWENLGLTLHATTRISFVMPAYNKMLLDLNYTCLEECI